MDKGDIIKLAGLLIVPVIVFTVAMYFLYPVISKDKYERIAENFERKQNGLPPLPDVDSLVVSDSLNVDGEAKPEINSDTLTVDMLDAILAQQEVKQNNPLKPVVDSLNAVIANLEKQLEEEKKKASSLVEETKNQEEFAVRVKSLLNLEENELAPILDKMSSKQLVKLYNSGGSTQREKILRSLNSEKAARLMTEVML
tara:strand:+ start:199688 stop:200284 length:597 start_codon:yes stop_codon:yes gene_type:complete